MIYIPGPTTPFRPRDIGFLAMLAALALALTLILGARQPEEAANAPVAGTSPAFDVAPLGRALTAACDVTGCDAEPLPSMLAAAVRAMTEAELSAALAAQGRLLREGARIRDAAAPGSAARRRAELEAAAAARLAELYRAELRSR